MVLQHADSMRSPVALRKAKEFDWLERLAPEEMPQELFLSLPFQEEFYELEGRLSLPD